MDVTSVSSVPVAWLLWQPRRDAWMLTVVAKLTYHLAPRTAALASTQEPVAPNDVPWDGDSSKSLRIARDLVPAKALVDLLVVGHAYAPRGSPVQSLVARVSVGEVFKSVEVTQDRFAGSNGAVTVGAPFTKMSLAYERAAGGPNTANPVGMARDARDGAGRLVLPNLSRPGAAPLAHESIGLGPIPATWPERMTRLGPLAATFSIQSLSSQPLPADFDLGFFNAAPVDQQLRALRDDERIVLENLHPEHALLATSLPGVKLRAIVERRGSSQPIAMRADTLWIDTDRGIATVTHRGTTPLEREDEQVRVVVSTEGPPSPGGPTRSKTPLRTTVEIQRRPRAASTEGPNGGPPHTPPPPTDMAPGWAGSALEVPTFSPPPRLEPAAPDEEKPANAAVASYEPSIETAKLRALAPGPDLTAGSSLELSWVGHDAAQRMRHAPALRALFAAEPDDPGDGLDVFRVLARAGAASTDELRTEYTQCQRADGRFIPSVVVVQGVVELLFDEVAELEVTVAIAGLAAAPSEGTKAALVAARIFLAGVGTRPASIAAILRARIEEALGDEKRAQQSLEPHRERALIDDRRYQRRSVFGGPHLRASFENGHLDATTPRGNARAKGTASGTLVVYVPLEAANELPLSRRFPARLLAELRAPVDVRDPSAPALRALTVGRLIPRG